MNKLIFICALSLLGSGCALVPEKQNPECSGVALVAGKETQVQIYGVRKIANQTQYRAGYPFSWKWISKNNFISNTCS